MSWSQKHPARGVVRLSAPAEHNSDQRSEARVRVVFRIGKAVLLGDSGLCRIMNISNHGIMIETDLPLSVGDVIEIGLTDQYLVEGHVIWRGDGRAGLEFTKPVECFALLRQLADQHWSGSSRMPRLPVVRNAVIHSEIGASDVTLQDISQRGMKIRHSARFRPGLAVKVQLENGVEVPGMVRWSSDGTVGIQLSGMLPYEQLKSVTVF